MKSLGLLSKNTTNFPSSKLPVNQDILNTSQTNEKNGASKDNNDTRKNIELKDFFGTSSSSTYLLELRY